MYRTTKAHTRDMLLPGLEGPCGCLGFQPSEGPRRIMAAQESGEVPESQLSLQGSAQMSPLPGSPQCFPALVTCADPLGLCTVPDASGPQPFWHQGPASWKIILPWTGGVGGMISDNSSALYITFIVWFISIIIASVHLRSPGIRSWRLGTPV